MNEKSDNREFKHSAPNIPVEVTSGSGVITHIGLKRIDGQSRLRRY